MTSERETAPPDSEPPATDSSYQSKSKLGVELSHNDSNPPAKDDERAPRDSDPPAVAAAAAAEASGNPFFQIPPGMSLGPFPSRGPPVPARSAAKVQSKERTDADQKPFPGAGRKGSAPARIKRRRGPGGLTRLHGVSPELQTIVGESIMPRTQIIKQFWAYIRKNNLQDPNNKRNIICNDGLRLVLETDCTDIFQMNKLLAKHITPLEPNNKVAVKDSRKLKTENVAKAKHDAASGLMTPSAVLAEFLGTKERVLQSEASIRMWNYIKDNQLEISFYSPVMCRYHLLGSSKLNDIV